jgi:hypothetical protein
MVNADDYLKQTHKHEHPLSDVDKFINEHLLGYPPKNIWDDSWMIGETNAQEQDLPSNEDQ